MNRPERRKFNRLPVTLNLLCREVGSTAEELHKARTVNVSPGGLFFETTTDTFKPGSLLKVELSIPPTVGLLEFGGRISGFARVLRTCNLCGARTDADLHPNRYGVALEFCQSLKLCK